MLLVVTLVVVVRRWTANIGIKIITLEQQLLRWGIGSRILSLSLYYYTLAETKINLV